MQYGFPCRRRRVVPSCRQSGSPCIWKTFPSGSELTILPELGPVTRLNLGDPFMPTYASGPTDERSVRELALGVLWFYFMIIGGILLGGAVAVLTVLPPGGIRWHVLEIQTAIGVIIFPIGFWNFFSTVFRGNMKSVSKLK